MSPVDSREPRPEREQNFFAFAALWLIVAIVVAVVVFAARSARAMDHGWDPTNPFSQWVESLKRPASGYKYSCCGKGDLYEVQITQDAIGETGDDMGTFVITDGSEIQYPDGMRRPFIANGTVFRFAKSIVNDRQGNPTKTAFAFIGDGGYLWCVVPLPGAV